MERDPQKAVGLIRGAAENDLPEAIKKLASMYHDGDGVKRDYEEEVVWLRKMVEVRRKVYELSGEEYNGLKLISSCWALGDALYATRKLSEAKEAYELMLRSAEKYMRIILDLHPGKIQESVMKGLEISQNLRGN